MEPRQSILKIMPLLIRNKTKLLEKEVLTEL